MILLMPALFCHKDTGGISYLSLCLYDIENTSDLISDLEWTSLLLPSPSEHYTFSPETSQTITLNGTRGYFITISDPVFSVASANPETIPRTLINLPPGGGTVQIYLTVNIFLEAYWEIQLKICSVGVPRTSEQGGQRMY